MEGLLNTNSDEVLSACLNAARVSVDSHEDSRSAKLTYAALTQFGSFSGDKPAPTLDTKLKERVVKTGAYYFGPMFVLDKGTGIPTSKILKELQLKGFYTEPLKFMNNAQLNLFFITVKCRGLVTDRHFMGYVKYGV